MFWKSTLATTVLLLSALADDTYEDRGEFLRMIGSALNLVVPDGDVMSPRWNDAEARRSMGGGSGSYTLEVHAYPARP